MQQGVEFSTETPRARPERHDSARLARRGVSTVNGGRHMRKSVFAVAAAAALVASVAVAQEIKQEQKPLELAPSQSGPARMTDAEMDKVTAGSADVDRQSNSSESSDHHGQTHVTVCRRFQNSC